MNKTFFKGLVSEVKENGIVSVAVATDASIDRDGEIVDPKGLDTQNFERNPVLLWAHDYRQEPIGKVLEIRKEGDRVLFQPQLAIDISPRAKMYFEMIKAGILSAFSIGFIPKEWSDRDNGSGGKNRVFTKSELLEISLVPVPANPNALVLARSFASKMEGSAEEKETAESIVKEIEAEAQKAIEKEMIGATIEKAIEPIRTMVADIQKEINANKGENRGTNGASVEELIKHPSFSRGVLAAVDKALGQTLGRMKQRS